MLTFILHDTHYFIHSYIPPLFVFVHKDVFSLFFLAVLANMSVLYLLLWRQEQFSVTWSFRNYSNMLICFKKHLLLLSMLKTVVLLHTFLGFFNESSKGQHIKYLYKKKKNCNIINVFTLTFEQFNDLILLGKQNLADPKLLTNNVFLIIDIYYVLIMSCLYILYIYIQYRPVCLA